MTGQPPNRRRTAVARPLGRAAFRAALAATALALGVTALAQQSPPAASPPAEQKAPPPPPPADAKKPADGDQAAAPAKDAPQSNDSPRGVIKDDEFIPTQELQPDEDVTFPVDI
jgi:hypothetical protein